MRDEDDVQLIPAMTHGRIRVRAARAAAARGVLVGFHGYLENLSMQMERLLAIPGAAAWTLVSVQGLHRVYRGRPDEVVASWMTREDREEAIADNLAYVDAALDAVPHDGSTRIVYTGFSQGVAMAFRAALLGHRRAAGVIAVGGDVPPELLPIRRCSFHRSSSRAESATTGSPRRNSTRTSSRCRHAAPRSVRSSTRAPTNGTRLFRRRPGSFSPRCSGPHGERSDPSTRVVPCARSGQGRPTANAVSRPYASEASAVARIHAAAVSITSRKAGSCFAFPPGTLNE